MAYEQDQPTVSDPSHDHQYEATRVYDPTESVSHLEEENIAFAAELLQSGIVKERDVTTAISDWSIHGHMALADHLAKRGILHGAQIETLRQRAAARIDRARQSAANGSQGANAGKSLLLATLERLDHSGRVAKLLGITIAACSGDHEARVMEGRYELIRKLGQGGLGRVWLARDVNLNRYVALKEMSHAAGICESMIQRFKHEAEITGRLDHPSIVPIYQLGIDFETKRTFYTMRFLGRTTLQDAIGEYHERRQEGDDDPMLLRNLLTAFVSVCHAIGHAHSRNTIHRDLKPENVVIDNFGQVIVIDWGLAKIIDDTSVECLLDWAAADGANLTSDGQVLGTPLYMAPEQAAGRLDELDFRTDIYGLGAILFAIVTGNAPHESTQKESADSGLGLRGMISVIANGVTPSVRDAHPDADPALEAICNKAMARRRYARYQHATELADEVQRWMAGEPVLAYQETVRQRVNRWISQHQRLSQAILAAVMLALVVLTTLAMVARQNRLTAQNARFAEMDHEVREVEIQMRDMWTELAQDCRFLASLPPIEGIVRKVQSAESNSDPHWHDQLTTIFTEILRPNDDYLSVSFESKEADTAKDLVRAERNEADPTLLRVVPASRLLSVKDDSLLAVVETLPPGALKFSLDPRTRYGKSTSQAKQLAVVTPVYNDESGNFFGMVVIEADVLKRATEVLTELGTVHSEIYVADGTGQMWACTKPESGVQIAHSGETIPELPKEVIERLSKSGDPFRILRERHYVAQRFYVDPTGRGVMIFARMSADR